MALMFHTPITQFDTESQHTLGETYTHQGKTYKYVKFLDAVTYVSGQLLEYANVACTSVTNDRSGGSSLGRVPAGVVWGAPTQNQHGWIQTKGPASGVLTSGADDIAVNEYIIPHATTDGTVDGTAAGTDPVGSAGYAVEADDNTANTVAMILTCP